VRIPKGSYDNEALAPAWLPISDRDGHSLKPIIRCKCGELAVVGLHHVHADGRVTASFYHPIEGWAGDAKPGCGFHESLELDGYATDADYAGREFPPR
jgi:hypothetical protein